MEGNALTEIETRIVIEDGITIGGKPLKDHYEAIGHSEAYSHLFELAKRETITEQDIKGCITFSISGLMKPTRAKITSIPPVLRTECIRAIVKGQVEPVGDTPFVELIAKMVMESQKDYPRLLK